MNPTIVYNAFMDEVRQKMPDKTNMVNTFSKLLFLEKEAVYRRLRGDVPFTFAEVIKISRFLKLSLDRIVEQSGTTCSCKAFYIKSDNFITPQENDYKSLQEHVDLVASISKDTNSEIGWTSGILTTPLSTAYTHLYNFYLFKWNYQFDSIAKKRKKYADIKASNRLMAINNEYLKHFKQIDKTIYVFNERMFFDLINDISYFVSVRQITQEEVSLLVKELYCLIDELETLAINGSYESGKKVEIYISPITHESNYAYFKSCHHCLTLTHSLTLSAGYSIDKQIFEDIKCLTNSLMRTATLISESGEIERIVFFDKQRKAIEESNLLRK